MKDPKDAPAYAEKYARYSVISGILRSEDQRKRYDVRAIFSSRRHPGSRVLTWPFRMFQFFYKNGVPKWKGAPFSPM